MMHLPSTPDEQSFDGIPPPASAMPQTRERMVLAPNMHRPGCGLDDNTSSPIFDKVRGLFVALP